MELYNTSDDPPVSLQVACQQAADLTDAHFRAKLYAFSRGSCRHENRCPTKAKIREDQAMQTIGIMIFDDVEELDFVGPLEVFGMASRLGTGSRNLLVAEHAGPIRCR